MQTSETRTPILLITAGTLVALTALFAIESHATRIGLVCAGILLAQSSVFWLWSRKPSGDDPLSDDLASERSCLQQERKEFEEWRTAQTEAFRQQSQRIEERNRDLLERSVRFQEFAEYPSADSFPESHLTVAQFSERDSRVNAILEQEAERVYEKIRSNGYSSGGTVDLDAIRTEVLDLIQRIARVYAPDSENPLLETSFEQLARSISRICLHSLVLLEQLPMDVQRYTINELYGYLRKAAQGYGAYQQIAPWLNYLTRTAYVGRMATGANPVAMGAWWLATELGRRGARRLVENVVDRQAVAVLHDVITVVGVEVANVYGPGYRQRDAAWVYGTELAELLSRFPVSRDALSAALREVTALPLRSEYDRIYLYRCVANHHSAELRITDPAVLPRAAREDIAGKLEAFYGSHIHGKTPELQQAWQQDLESRLDLKLHGEGIRPARPAGSEAEAGLRTIHAFLTTVLDTDVAQAARLVEGSELLGDVPLENRSPLLQDMAENSLAQAFEPPDYDPAADITNTFLNSLFTCSLQTGRCDQQVEELLVETACYFRRSRDEAVQLLHACLAAQVKRHFTGTGQLPALDGPLARALLQQLQKQDGVLAIYSKVAVIGAPAPAADTGVALAVLEPQGRPQDRRAMLITADQNDGLAWVSDATATILRRKGFFTDDCEIRGGHWLFPAAEPPHIVVSGTIGSGRYNRFFAPLLFLPEAAAS
ncbi:MAG: hypothetical protein RIK87_00310 [Fuerstiella sp.]